MKATEGASLVDKTYARNLSEARRVGLVLAATIFTDRTLIGNNNSEHDFGCKKGRTMVPIIDIEHRGNVSMQAFIIGDLRAFIEKVTEYYGKKPLLYTYHNFYNKYLDRRVYRLSFHDSPIPHGFTNPKRW